MNHIFRLSQNDIIIHIIQKKTILHITLGYFKYKTPYISDFT